MKCVRLLSWNYLARLFRILKKAKNMYTPNKIEVESQYCPLHSYPLQLWFTHTSHSEAFTNCCMIHLFCVHVGGKETHTKVFIVSTLLFLLPYTLISRWVLNTSFIFLCFFCVLGWIKLGKCDWSVCIISIKSSNSFSFFFLQNMLIVLSYFVSSNFLILFCFISWKMPKDLFLKYFRVARITYCLALP